MHLVSTDGQKKDGPVFSDTPLSVVFAEADPIAAVREAGSGPIPLEAPFHLSDDDRYLVLPDDIGIEFVDIMGDGDHELLAESMRDGLFVEGAVAKAGKDDMLLHAESVVVPKDALNAGMPYAATVTVGGDIDPLEAIHALPHVQCTVVSQLLDDDGLERVLRKRSYVGPSWHMEDPAAGIDPTYIWSRRIEQGRVGVELALFMEYEELVVLVRPLELVPA